MLWLGIKPETLWFADQHSIHWATPARGLPDFFSETSNYASDSALLQPRLGTLWLLAFPKTKITLKGKRFQTIYEVQENTTGQLMAIGRTVWSSKMTTLKGTEMSLSYIQWFLYLVSSSINVSIFHITWLDTFWTDFDNHVVAHNDNFILFLFNLCVFIFFICSLHWLGWIL